MESNKELSLERFCCSKDSLCLCFLLDVCSVKDEAKVVLLMVWYFFWIKVFWKGRLSCFTSSFDPIKVYMAMTFGDRDWKAGWNKAKVSIKEASNLVRSDR